MGKAKQEETGKNEQIMQYLNHHQKEGFLLGYFLTFFFYSSNWELNRGSEQAAAKFARLCHATDGPKAPQQPISQR